MEVRVHTRLEGVPDQAPGVPAAPYLENELGPVLFLTVIYQSPAVSGSRAGTH